MNGPVICKTWKVTDQYSGKEYTPGCDPDGKIRAIDYFMALFPKDELVLIVTETSRTSWSLTVTRGLLAVSY